MQTIDITERRDTDKGLRAFVMTLRPRRSADPKVAYVLCGILGVVWLVAGIFITTFGGWPVFGFFGAEFIFIAYCVHIFTKRGQLVETVEITADEMKVERSDLKGRESKTFPAYWAQVHYNGSSTENGTLEIRSHGEGFEIGAFLSASEKDRTAWKLNDILARLKAQGVHQPADETRQP